MKEVALVALGGSLGALLRYGLGKWLQHTNPHPSFSAGTLLANLVGCVLMGLLVVYAAELNEPQKQAFAAFLLTGFLGSLTTFSTFILEFFKLSQTGDLKLVISHAAGHLLVGLFGLWAGHSIGQRFIGSQ